MTDPERYPREWKEHPKRRPVKQPPGFPGWRLIGAVFAKKQAGELWADSASLNKSSHAGTKGAQAGGGGE